MKYAADLVIKTGPSMLPPRWWPLWKTSFYSNATMNLIDSLLTAMTLEEKIGQLNMAATGYAITGPILGDEVAENIRAGRVGGLLNLWGREAIAGLQKLAVKESKLAIPLLFGLDVLHGHKTIFPIPLAEAGLFDPLLWERTARAAAIEAAGDGITLTFAPMLDIARDPRWGRIAEGPGEDPLVGARFAEAKIRGFQGPDLAAGTSVAATAKHFCAGGAATAGRDYAAVDISERTLIEVYLPPFRAAVAAGCAAIMPAFNSVAGVPMTAHAALLRDYLRRKLGFEGLIISDYNAIPELMQHGVAADLTEAAALSLKAGVDMDMMSGAYVRCLPDALARGLVAQEDVDAAVRRVLKLKQNLGLFDDPCRRVAPAEYLAEAQRELALDVARRAITLLSNRDILPRSRQRAGSQYSSESRLCWGLCLRPPATGPGPMPPWFCPGNRQGGCHGLGGLLAGRTPWLHQLGGVHGQPATIGGQRQPLRGGARRRAAQRLGAASGRRYLWSLQPAHEPALHRTKWRLSSLLLPVRSGSARRRLVPGSAGDADRRAR
jgi:beta-glucosidase-like glycosyl hydrolase